MHYMNGRPAKEMDYVVHKDRDTGIVRSGRVQNLTSQSTKCNASLVTQSLTGVTVHIVNLSDCLHAEDAIAVWEDQVKKAG